MNTDNLNFDFKMNKIEATKYILKGLCDWYYELNPTKQDKDNNDLSILKVLKLFFFLSTVKYNKHDLLENPFDEFKAMPLGPVETDVYDYFTSNLHIIDYSKINLKNLNLLEINLTESNKNFIDNIFNELKQKNIDLINKNPYYLVDLSHEWTCWIDKYEEAKEDKKRSKPMTPNDIRNSQGRLYTF